MGLGMSVALSVATASALTVNGNLSDWGITVADGDNSNFSNPNLGIGLVNSLTEDQSDFAGNSGYVGPNYDAEYMGIAVQGTTCISPSFRANALITASRSIPRAISI